MSDYSFMKSGFNNLEENTIFNIKSILEEHGINIINCSDDVINSYRL